MIDLITDLILDCFQSDIFQVFALPGLAFFGIFFVIYIIKSFI